MFVSEIHIGDEIASHQLKQWLDPCCVDSGAGVQGSELHFDLSYQEYRLHGSTKPEWEDRELFPAIALWQGVSRSEYDAGFVAPTA